MDLILLLQTVLGFITIILGLLATIPIGITRTSWYGMCVLYPEFKGNILYPTQTASCEYPMYTSLIIGVLYAAVLTIYHGKFFYGSLSDPNKSCKVWVMPFVLINSVCALFCLVSACLISVGLKTLCDGFEEAFSVDNCELFEVSEWKFEGVEVVKGEGVRGRLKTSEIGAWLLFLIWLFHVGIGVFRFFQLRRQGTYSRRQQSEDSVQK